MSEIKNEEKIEEKIEEKTEETKESKFEKFKQGAKKVGGIAWICTKKTCKVALEGAKALAKGVVNACADSTNAMIDEVVKTENKKEQE